jgi:hypothetical protein
VLRGTGDIVGFLRGFHRARQDGYKDAAFAQLAMYRNTAALRFHDVLGKREAESGAAESLGRTRVELLELDKKTGHIVRSDTNSSVLDFKPEAIVTLRLDADHNGAVFRGELDRV